MVQPSKKVFARLFFIVLSFAFNHLLKAERLEKKLSLQNFLDQVQLGNQDFQAYSRSSQGAKLRALEYQFLTSPQLFGEICYGEDKALPETPTKPNDNRKTCYSFGIQQQFSFGLGAKFAYTLSKYDLRGMANPLLFQPPEYYTAKPSVELSLSLFKNLLGRETRAQQIQIENAGRVKQWADSFRAKMMLVEAEVSYWKLSLMRKLVESAQQNLKRAEKIKGWSTRRKKLGLADESQYLQADSNFELRQLDYFNAVDDERVSRRKLNTLRGVDNDVVMEDLQEPSPKIIFDLKLPSLYNEREDLKAARAEAKIKKASAVAARERFKPSVDLVGSYAWNGKETDGSSAVNEGWKNDHRSYGVALRFSMPLDVFLLSRQMRGYKFEEKAAQMQLDRKEFDARREWEDLRLRFSEGRERFKSILKIEEAQSKKLLRERELQDRGRSTLFTVLQFESEYAASQIARVKAEIELLGLYAQLKSYENAEEGTEK